MKTLVAGLAVLCLVLLVALSLVLLKGNPWRAVAVANGQQATINQGGAVINDRRAANTARATKAAKEAADAVEAAPDLEGALAEFDAGIDRVRAEGHRPVDRTDAR